MDLFARRGLFVNRKLSVVYFTSIPELKESIQMILDYENLLHRIQLPTCKTEVKFLYFLHRLSFTSLSHSTLSQTIFDKGGRWNRAKYKS